MTNTFKTLLFSLLLTGLSFAATAQRSIPDTLRIGAGLEGGIINGDFGAQYKAVIGASVRIDYPITRKLYITANAGYSMYTAASGYKGTDAITGVQAADFKTIPLKLGVKYFLFSGFYAQGEVGQTLLTNKKEVYAIYKNSLTVAPQFGMLFRLKNRTYIDGGIRYEAVSSFYNSKTGYNFWGAHVTYAFNL